MADDSLGSTNPEWATEKTLRDLLGEASKTTSIDENILKSVVKTGRITENLAMTLKNQLGKNAKDVRADKDLAGMKSGLKGMDSQLDDTTENVDEFGQAVKDSGSSLKKFGQSMGAMSIGILGFLVQQLKEAAKTTIESVDAIRGLHQVGVAVEGSFIEFKRTIAEAGISTEKAMQLTDQYSKVLGSQGVPGLVRLSKSIYEMDQEMGKVGLTVSELSEYAGEYLEIQQRAGYYQRIDTAQQRDSMHGFMTSLTAYSRIMNISTKEMIESSKDAAKQIDWNAWIAGIVDPAERQRVNDEMAKTQALFLNQFGPEAGAKMFEELQQMVAQPAAQASSAFQSYAESGQVGFANAMAAVADALEHGTGDVTNLIAQLGTSIDRGTMQMLVANKEAIPTLSTIGQAAGQFEVAVGKVAELTDKTYEEVYAIMLSGSKEYSKLLLSTVDETTKAAAGVIQEANETVEGLDFARMNLFLKAIGVNDQDGAIGALNSLKGAISSFNDKFIGDFLNKKVAGGIEEFVNKIKWAIDKLDTVFGTDLAGPITTALTSLGVLLGGTAVVGGAAGAGIKALLAKGLAGLGFGAAGAGAGAGTAAAGTAAAGAGSVLLPAAALTAAAYGGWKFGSAVYDNYEDTEGMMAFGDLLGGGVDRVLSLFGNEEAQRRLEINRGEIQPAQIASPPTGRIERPTREENAAEPPQPLINTTNMTEAELLSNILQTLTGIEQHSGNLLRQVRNNTSGLGMPAGS